MWPYKCKSSRLANVTGRYWPIKQIYGYRQIFYRYQKMLVLKNTKRCLGWFRVITFPVNITVSVHCCLLLHLLISASVLISELFDFLSVLIMVLKCAYQSVTPTPFVFTLQVSVWRTAGCAFEFPFSNLYHLESKRGSLRLLAMFLYWLYFSGTCSSSLLKPLKPPRPEV